MAHLVGSTDIRPCIREIEIDWTVDFSSPSMADARLFYCSDLFEFSERKFFLFLAPERHAPKFSTSLYVILVDSGRPIEMRYTLAISKMNGEMEQSTNGTFTFEKGSDGPSLKWLDGGLENASKGIVTFKATLKTNVTDFSRLASGSEVPIVGRIREIKCTPVYKELLWEIDDAYHSLSNSQECDSPTFLFNASDCQLTLGFIRNAIVMRLGVESSEHFYWNAGIRRVDGTECWIGSGQVTAYYCLSRGSWMGPPRQILFKEKLALVPEGVLTLFVRISALMACGGPTETSVKKQDIPAVERNEHQTLEKAVTADASVETENDINEPGSIGFKGWKPTEDDMRTIQQYRQMLRSDEDREYILRVRREEGQAKLREQFNQLRLSGEDDGGIYKLSAA